MAFIYLQKLNSEHFSILFSIIHDCKLILCVESHFNMLFQNKTLSIKHIIHLILRIKFCLSMTKRVLTLKVTMLTTKSNVFSMR